MTTLEQIVDVDVPVRTAYDQWTQFETFPEFMHNITSVAQHGDDMLHWEARAGAAHRSWEARIVAQEPDRLIAWAAVDGTENSGTVRFEPLAEDRTRIQLEMTVADERWTEKVAGKLGVLDTVVESDLDRFKQYIEDRGAGGETGAWRGRLPADGYDEDLSPPSTVVGAAPTAASSDGENRVAGARAIFVQPHQPPG